MHQPELEPDDVLAPNPIGDADLLESILDSWDADGSAKASEFWSWQVLESLSHLFGAVMASLSAGGSDGARHDLSGADLGEYRMRTKSLLVEIRDLLDQLWWADWPSISTPLDREIREVVAHVRENEQLLKPPGRRWRSRALGFLE